MAENKKDSGEEKAGSATELLDELAEKLGVQEEEGDESAALPAAEAVETAAPAPEKSAPEKSASEESGKKGKKGKSAAPAPAATPSPARADGLEVSEDGRLSGVFALGPDETPPSDPTQSPLYDATMEEEGVTKSYLPIFLGVSIASLVVLGILFAIMPQQKRTELVRLLQGYDIIEERRLALVAAQEEERRQRMEAAPRFGTVQITTIPNNFLVEAEGLPEDRYPNPVMIFRGTRRDQTTPTRAQVTYENIPSDRPFRFTVRGGGVYQDREVVIPPFRDDDSPWQQDFTGSYFASLTITMDPVEDNARELAWRRAYRPDLARDRYPLMGVIVLNTEPPGARIAYNNIWIRDGEGNVLTTPMTFAAHPAPEGHSNQDPRPVFLLSSGARIDIQMEGKANVDFGVYLHEFTCEPREGATPPPADAQDPDFYGYCNYVYRVTVPLLDPLPEPVEEPNGAEESAAQP